eukprot:g6.t1
MSPVAMFLDMQDELNAIVRARSTTMHSNASDDRSPSPSRRGTRRERDGSGNLVDEIDVDSDDEDEDEEHLNLVERDEFLRELALKESQRSTIRQGSNNRNNGIIGNDGESHDHNDSDHRGDGRLMSRVGSGGKVRTSNPHQSWATRWIKTSENDMRFIAGKKYKVLYEMDSLDADKDKSATTTVGSISQESNDSNSERVLGEGTYSRVKIIRNEATKTLYALKCMKKSSFFSSEEAEAVRREIKIHRTLPEHPSLIRFIESFEDKNHLYMVLEYANYGNIQQHLEWQRSFSENKTCRIIFDLLCAVAHLHEHGTIHTDIKPENLLLSVQVKTVDMFTRNLLALRHLVRKKGLMDPSNPLIPIEHHELPMLSPRKHLGATTTTTTTETSNQATSKSSSGYSNSPNANGKAGHGDEDGQIPLASEKKTDSAASNIKSTNTVTPTAQTTSGSSGEANGNSLWSSSHDNGNDSEEDREWINVTSLKLCDLGCARKVPDVANFEATGDVNKVPFNQVIGTPGYVAPEILSRKPFGKKADVWSVGVVMFECLAGYSPWYPASDCLSSPLVIDKRIEETLSPFCTDLLRKMLVVNDAKRISSREASKHRWFDRLRWE